MALTGNHLPGDAGHTTDHNSIDATLASLEELKLDVADANSTFPALLKSAIHVQEAPYNVVADGVYRASATTQLQAALDLADTENRPIYWGDKGTIVTDTLNYRSQSMFGQTVIQGRPSKDVFHFDPTLSAYTRDGHYLRDLQIVVDDSVNAATSFPQRGGVGNAGFACDFANGAGTRPLHWSRTSFENVLIRSLSMTSQNKSCSFYNQHLGNQMRIRDVTCFRTEFGWWDHYPTSNLTAVEHFSDHNHVDSIYFNGCTNPSRFVNWANSKFSNYTQHSCPNGPQMTGVVSANRASCHEIEIGTVMIEEVTTNPWNVAGNFFTVKNLWIAGTFTTATFATDESTYESIAIASNNPAPYLTITGSRNKIENLAVPTLATTHGYDTISDQGRGNRVVLNYQTANPRHRGPQNLTRDGRTLHERDATGILMGHTNTLMVSGNDLLINPLLVIPDGVAFSYATDLTADFGVKMIATNPGGFLANNVNGDYGFAVGRMLPATKGRIYIKGKVDTATTQQWNFDADAVSKGNLNISWTTSYTVQSFEYDLTGISESAALRLRVNNLAIAGDFHLAWIAFRPYAADVLSTGVVKTGAAVTGSRPSATTPGSGSHFFDTTLSKPIYSNGTAWKTIQSEEDASNTYRKVLGCPAPSGDVTGVTDRAAVQAVIDLAATLGVQYVQLQTAPASSPYWVNTAVHPTDSAYQSIWAVPPNVTLCGMGMTATVVKLADNSVGAASGKGPHLIMNKNPTAGTDEGVRYQDFTLDGNAANQTDVFNGLCFIRGRGHGTTRTRVKNIRGTAASGANETFHYVLNQCADVRQVDCEAVGDAGSTASGFASNGATNVTRIGCTARGMTVSQGFTDWKSGVVSNLGCVAYGNAAGGGFNAEDCDQITYSGCHSGGKAGKAADGFPFAANATLPANLYGFVLNGCNRFSLQGCTGRYNTNGIVFTNNYTTLSGTVDGGSFSDNTDFGITSSVAVNSVKIGPTVECLRNTTANMSIPVIGNGDLHGPLGTPAMPATDVFLVNPFPAGVTVLVSGGTVTAVQVNGEAGGAQAYGTVVSGPFRLPAGASIKLTYSAAPTWYWVAD